MERTSYFTRFTNVVKLIVPPRTNVGAARKLLAQAERGCLIANSLHAARTLTAEVSTREV